MYGDLCRVLTHCKHRKCRRPVCRSRWQCSQVPPCALMQIILQTNKCWSRRQCIRVNTHKCHGAAENYFARPQNIFSWDCDIIAHLIWFLCLIWAFVEMLKFSRVCCWRNSEVIRRRSILTYWKTLLFVFVLYFLVRCRKSNEVIRRGRILTH